MGSHAALVKGNLHMGFQVDRVTHILWFWLKEIARWDIRIMKKREREKERKTRKKNRIRFLDEVDIEQVKQTERQVFLYKAYYAKH